MMRSGIVAAAAVIGLLSVGEARADVIFQFVTTSYGTNIGLPGVPLAATFDLVNTGETGSFTITRDPNSTPTLVASSTVKSAVIQGVDVVSMMDLSSNPIGRAFVSLAFMNGVVTSSSIRFFGRSDEVQISGTGPTASGFLGSDNPGCGSSSDSQRCSVSGYFVQVPEPMTIMLFGTAALGLAVLRRRA